MRLSKKKWGIWVFLALVMFLFMGCAKKEAKHDVLEGTTWIAPAGPGMNITFSFKKDGKVTVVDPGGSHEMTYTIDGDVVHLSDGAEYHLNGDGTEMTGTPAPHPGAPNTPITYKKQ